MQTPSTPDRFQQASRAMQSLRGAVRESGVDFTLLELVRYRVSQINGCGYCLDMHSKDALHAGETPQRLVLLSVWRETPLYTPRERAALAWAEALTQLAHGIPHDVREQVKREFSEQELTALTFAVVEINAWNRIAIPFEAVPGTYRVGQHG